MAQIKGLDSFFDVLEIIKDPAKYDAKLQELKQQVAQYKEVVEAVVSLAKVNEYTVSIRERELKSAELLAQAERDVAAVITNAQVEADNLKNEARMLKEESIAENKAIKDLKKQLKEQLQKATDETSALQQAQKELQTRQLEVEAQGQELASRLEKIKSVMQ